MATKPSMIWGHTAIYRPPPIWLRLLLNSHLCSHWSPKLFFLKMSRTFLPHSLCTCSIPLGMFFFEILLFLVWFQDSIQKSPFQWGLSWQLCIKQQKAPIPHSLVPLFSLLFLWCICCYSLFNFIIVCLLLLEYIFCLFIASYPVSRTLAH